MKKALAFALATSVSLLTWAQHSLPEGSFKGDSSLINGGQNKHLLNYDIKSEANSYDNAYQEYTSYDRDQSGKNEVNGLNNDVMSFIVQKDQSQNESYYVIMSEYDRVPFTNMGRRFPLTKWVNRMYAYQMVQIAPLKYQMNKLVVDAAGDISADANQVMAVLELKSAKSFDGAKLTRYVSAQDKNVAEVVVLNGRVGSTWENYVPGDYFGSSDNTGGDYFDKTINTTITIDGVAKLNTKKTTGEFSIVEKKPKMFVLKAVSENTRGEDQVLNRIGVFIDIVNWKHLGIKKFTTEEFLLINPENASDVGFFYERHIK